MALDGRNGTVLWHIPLHSGWSNKGLALADVFGTGQQELLAEEYGPTGDDGIAVIDPHTGARLAWYALQRGWAATRGPVVADLQGDGYMEIVVPVTRPHAGNATYCLQKRTDVPCREGALEILATHQPFSSQYTNSFAWDQQLDAHAYDPTPRTHPTNGPPLAWPNEANARIVPNNGIPTPPPKPDPTPTPGPANVTANGTANATTPPPAPTVVNATPTPSPSPTTLTNVPPSDAPILPPANAPTPGPGAAATMVAGLLAMAFARRRTRK
jgi:hypothetical protein